nr:unnamed protein product [Digitaria exilis]
MARLLAFFKGAKLAVVDVWRQGRSYVYSLVSEFKAHTAMNSSVNHQWLAELENDDLGELDFTDPLSMQRLAESLAGELLDQPT